MVNSDFNNEIKALGLGDSPKHTLGELERYEKYPIVRRGGVNTNQSSQPLLRGPKEVGKIPNSLKYGTTANWLTPILGSSFDQSRRDVFDYTGCKTT